MQFLLHLPQSGRRAALQHATAFLFNELGFFFQHVEDARPAISLQIECYLYLSSDSKGIHFKGDFNDQLNGIETAIQDRHRLPIELEYTLTGSSLVISSNLIPWIYTVLAHREEQLFPDNQRDKHQRIPFSASLAESQEWFKLPRLSQAIQQLSEAIRRYLATIETPLFYKSPWPEKKQKAVSLTHDVDILDKWFLFAGKQFMEQLSCRQAGAAFRLLRSSAGNLLSGKNPATDVSWLLDLEQEYGFVSSWHFLMGNASLSSLLQSDITYSPKRILPLIPLLKERHAEIGLHSSYFTQDQPSSIKDQTARLKSTTGQPIQGVRAHFLRSSGLPFLQSAEREGLTWDSSEGFAEISGFKTGMTQSYHPILDDAPLKIREFPLHWMDRTYSKYHSSVLSEIYDDFIQLAGCFESYGGVFTLLWHNYTVSDLGFADYETLYRDMLAHLKRSGFYNDTPSQLALCLKKKEAVRLEIRKDSCSLLSENRRVRLPRPSDLLSSSIVQVDCTTLTWEFVRTNPSLFQ